MVRIYLHEAASYRGCTVTRQDYKPCSLFYKYDHVRTGWIGVDYIYVYKEYELWKFFVTYFTLNPYYSFPDQPLLKSEVYYNVFDTKRDHPLLLILYFKPGKLANVRYLKYTEFIFLVRGGSTVQLGTLKSFSGPDDKEILEALIVENDFNNKNLTYEIDKRSPGNKSFVYNVGRVLVTHDFVIGEGADKTHGFYKYTHKPYDNKPKISYVLYNKQVPLCWSGDQGKLVPINEIQDQVYSSISIYYSQRVREPLMLEFVKQIENRQEHTYYFQKKHDDLLYWQSLNHLSYKEILGLRSDGREIHTNLVSSQNKLLLLFLQKVESYLIKTIVILLDKPTAYSHGDVFHAVRKARFDPYDYRIINKNSDVKVNNISETCKSLSSKGYIVHEHDFSSIMRLVHPNEAVNIKFIRSEKENVIKNNFLIVDLDNRGHHNTDFGAYHSKSIQIQVTDGFNFDHQYSWYKHSVFDNLLEGEFEINFNGQKLTLHGNLDNSFNKKLLVVYFKYNYFDRFVLIAITSQDFKRIKYLTYSKFRKNILEGNTLKLSDLDETTGNISTRGLNTGIGYEMDRSVVSILDHEFSTIQSEEPYPVDTLSYISGEKKLYVYLRGDDLKPLMICYKSNPYTRYYLRDNKSLWRPLIGVNTCICNDNRLSDPSHSKFLDALNEMAILFGFIKPEKKIHSGKTQRPETEKHREVLPPSRREQDTQVELDISLSDKTAYFSHTFQVSPKFIYRESNLFCYYTYSPKSKGAVNIKSVLVKANSTKKSINFQQVVKNVNSINVYFNIFIPDQPIILTMEINSKIKYYKFDFQPDTYLISEDNTISSKLCDRLIEDGDRINKTLTYQLDKDTTTLDSDTYGYKNSIKLTKQQNVDNKGYTTFKHGPNSDTSKGYVLYKKRLLSRSSRDGGDPINEIQDKPYKEIKVYALDSRTNLPLLIELKQSSTTYLVLKDEQEFIWESQNVNIRNSDNASNQLKSIYYYLNRSLVIELDKGGGIEGTKGTSYQMRTIENKVDSRGLYEKSTYQDSQLVTPSKNITVSHPSAISDFRAKNRTSYKYVSHQFDGLDVSTTDNKDIAGIRIFIVKGTGSQPEEVFLYDSEANANNLKDRLLIHLSPKQSSSNKLFGYFHGEDPRVLLLCYEGNVYKRLNQEDNTKWIPVKTIKKCHDDDNIIITLIGIFEKMDKKVIFRNEGKEIHIKKNQNQSFHGFFKDTYSPDDSKQGGPFILPKTSLFPGEHSSLTQINQLLDNLNEETFERVNIYKTSKTFTLKQTLLIEFINESDRIYFRRMDSEANYWHQEKILHVYGNNIQNYLQDISSKVDKTIVYEIDKLTSNYNIYISLDIYIQQPSKNYNKYIHSPKSGYYDSYGCILYHGQKLLTKQSSGAFEPIEAIQNVEYEQICVYFSSRNYDLPLIIEFTHSKRNSSKTYYKHMMYESRSYWQFMHVKSTTLDSKNLISELKRVELDLFQSVVILMDQVDGIYGDTKIREAVSNLIPRKEIHTYPMDPECIPVKNVTDQPEGNCLLSLGFGIYQHNINRCVKEHQSAALRFFIPSTKGSNNYNEIKLYDGDALETIHFTKPTQDVNVYIYFYNGNNNSMNYQIGNSDPRPLMLCYRNSAYRPMKLTEYFDRWYKDPSVRECSCQGYGSNPQLINALSEVVGFLNEVQMEQRPHETYVRLPNVPGDETNTYDLQIFNNEPIKIQVSYQNTSCFRLYKHKPYGFYGDASGFRLGNLSYGSSHNHGISYPKSKQLKAVQLFYNLYDSNHRYPLLVTLEFKDNSIKDYYELNDINNIKWKKMTEHVDENYIETTIKALIKKLNIDFKAGEQTRTLFDQDECYEETNKTTIIAATSGTISTAAVVGTGTGLALKFPEWFIPVIKALV